MIELVPCVCQPDEAQGLRMSAACSSTAQRRDAPGEAPNGYHADHSTHAGRTEWPCGSVYEGEWAGDKMHGAGSLRKADGTTYSGSWVHGKKHGLGRQEHPNGDRYVGLWRNDVRWGPGRYKWQSGDEYAGEWLDGNMHGSGTLVLRTGDRYDGEYAGGRLHGQGIFTSANGAVYDGFWEHGQKHGLGLCYKLAKVVEDGRTSVSQASLDRKIARSSADAAMGGERFGSPDALRGHDGAHGAAFTAPLPASDSHVTSDILPHSEDDAAASGLDQAPPTKHRRRPSLSRADKDLPEMCVREYDHGVLLRSVPVRQREALELFSKMISRNHAVLSKSKAADVPITPKPGEVVERGHRSYELMLDLQLGIAWSVGKVTLEPLPDTLDASRFTLHQKIRFPRSGSDSTPPHSTHDFTWVDYAPMVFRKLRAGFGVDPAEYILSLCGKQALRMQKSPGKSGALFFMSHDDKYLIKTMRKSEVKFFLRMLDRYHEHMAAHPNSLLTHYYGLYKLTSRHLGRQIRVVVMGNIFREDVEIHRRYDLKGSTHGRTCKRPEVNGINLKDLDLDVTFELEPEWRAKLQQQLLADCGLLQRCRIMDYSMLLGVHFKARAQEESMAADDTSSLLPTQDAGEATEDLKRGVDSWNLPEQEAKDVLQIASAQLMRFRRSRQLLQVVGSRRARAQDSSDAELAFHLGEKPLRLGEGLHAVAHHKAGGSEEAVVYFGIIDMLQGYTALKRVEHALKAVRYGGNTVSVAPPDFYAKRFAEAMLRVLV